MEDGYASVFVLMRLTCVIILELTNGTLTVISVEAKIDHWSLIEIWFMHDSHILEI